MEIIPRPFIMRVCACLVIAGILNYLPRSVWAQRNPVYSSIESRVAPADDVYVGTISRISSFEYDKDLRYTAIMTVDATETIKGKPCKQFTVHLPDGSMVSDYRTWNRDHTPLLWFVKSDGTDGAPASSNSTSDSVSPRERWSALPVQPTGRSVGYFSMDFHLIKAGPQVLETVRRYTKIAAKNHSETATLHSLRYMPDLVSRLFPYRTGGELLVPIGPELEKLARRMILSPGSILPSEREIKGISHEAYLASKVRDEGSVRRMGVEALGHFKSDANIDLVKRQLNDPFFEPIWEEDKNVYSVRKTAFEVLRKWGVEVTEPQVHPSSEVSAH